MNAKNGNNVKMQEKRRCKERTSAEIPKNAENVKCGKNAKKAKNAKNEKRKQSKESKECKTGKIKGKD